MSAFWTFATKRYFDTLNKIERANKQSQIEKNAKYVT